MTYLISKTTKTNTTLLTVENVSKKFCRNLKQSLKYGVQDIITELIGQNRNSEKLRDGEFWALQNINLQLRPGEALGLVGANGAGKTTTINMLATLLRPDRGKARHKDPEARRRSAAVGMEMDV